MGTADVGVILGSRYELLAPTASGATATVWQAHDEFLRRHVAVKVLYEHLRTDHDLVARFSAEARTAAGVNHPALVAVYDTITDPPAIVMEWVDGPDLRQRLTQGPLPTGQVIELGAALCGGLTALHTRGLVHRDVKPANVLLPGGGSPKLTDFGIATANAGDRTATGVVLGTAKYLAPEQVRGAELDGRTDLYALACVLYEALAGHPPFEREGDLPTAFARLEVDPVPLGDIRPDVDPLLTDAIMTGLAREPVARWATADDFAHALRQTAAGGEFETTDLTSETATLTTRPATSPARTAALHVDRSPSGASRPRPDLDGRRRRWRRTALLVVAAAIVILGVVLINGPPDRSDRATGAALTVAGVRTFDPEGTGPPGEHDDLVGRAIDGDPATAWTTELYERRDLGAKSGVGLIVVLEQTNDIHAVSIDTDSASSWAADVRVAALSPSELDAARAPADFGPVVGGGTDLAETAMVPVAGRGNAVLVWFTDLGEGPLPIRLVVEEVTVS